MKAAEVANVMGPRVAWIRAVCLLVLLHAVSINATKYRKWTPSTYPNPQKDVSLCGRNGVKSSICDPENILSIEAANMVDGLINEIAEGKAPFQTSVCGDVGPQGFQARWHCTG